MDPWNIVYQKSQEPQKLLALSDFLFQYLAPSVILNLKENNAKMIKQCKSLMQNTSV